MMYERLNALSKSCWLTGVRMEDMWLTKISITLQMLMREWDDGNSDGDVVTLVILGIHYSCASRRPSWDWGFRDLLPFNLNTFFSTSDLDSLILLLPIFYLMGFGWEYLSGPQHGIEGATFLETSFFSTFRIKANLWGWRGPWWAEIYAAIRCRWLIPDKTPKSQTWLNMPLFGFPPQTNLPHAASV